MARSVPEQCSLVFGVISIIISTLAIVGWTCFTIYITITMDEESEALDFTVYFHLGLMMGMLVTFFIFAVLLTNGVAKKKFEQVLAYFVFGVLWTALSLLGAVLFVALFQPQGPVCSTIAAVWFLITLIHIVILIMVYLAYRRIKADTRPKREVLTLTRKEMDNLAICK